MRLDFKVTNNEVEYIAIIAGLMMVKELKIKTIQIHIDSSLVANQVSEHFQAEGNFLALHVAEALKLINPFSNFKLKQITREKNAKIDQLVKGVNDLMESNP